MYRSICEHILSLAGLLVAPLIAAAVLGGCKPATGGAAASQRAAPPAVEVQLETVQTRPTDRYLELTGTLFGQEDVTVSAKVAGRVVALAADLGDTVDHGQTLAQIDRTDYQLAVQETRSSLLAALARLGLTEMPSSEVDLGSLPVVAKAEAEAANALARLTRARKLFERQPPLMSEQEFADIQTQSDVARTEAQSQRINAQAQLAEAGVRRASLSLAEQRLADATVIAPIELPLRYRVAARFVSVGEYVAPATPLYRLVATERVKFRGSVPERFAGQIAVDAPAQLHVDAYTQPFAARVARVSPAVDPTTRAFEIEIDAANADGRLKPGGFLRARVRAGVDNDARYVPIAAVGQFTGVQRLFSLREGKLVEHKVRTGDRSGEWIEVLDLPPAVTAVVSPLPKSAAPGAPAKIKQ